MERFLLTPEPIRPELVTGLVEGPDAGAVVSFIGTVRGETRGVKVLRLEYEAYDAMARRMFAAIAEEAKRFGDARLAVHHRLGACAVGEVTVVVAAAAPHRADAFDACRHGIERLKADAPIWKREVRADGAVWVGQGS